MSVSRLEQAVGSEIYDRLEETYYPPTGTYEWQDCKTGYWYSSNGDPIRDPEDYNTSAEGYTPFGDE